MSYNSILQSNNTDLQAILDTINALPEVEGSTSIDDVSKKIIKRTITEISDDNIETIGNHAFYKCSSLTTASFPVCTSISSYAFAYCSSLTTISFPACTNIGSYAFDTCSSLTTISFPVCTYIGNGTFYRCISLTTASFPVCTSISNSAFAICSSLTTISFPVCTYIGNGTFYECSSLTTASFPVCTYIGSYAFDECYKLSSLTLNASTICTLSNSKAFSSTPYAGYSAYFSGTPYIYVPASLVDAYKSATNWTYFSNYFSAIEDSNSGNENSGNEPTILITFTIDGAKYQAEEGMKWNEWVESEYNTNNFVVDGNAIANGMYMINNVLPSDMIVENKVYTTIMNGGAGN